MNPLKNTGVYRLLTAVLAGACALFGAVPARAAARPEWSPYRTAPFTLPAGERCSFGLSATPIRDLERIRTLAVFPDGTPRVQEVDGPLVVRYTNTDTDAFAVRDLTGRALVVYGADGGFREILESGRFAVGLPATDPGGPGFFVLSGSGAAVTVSPDGSRILAPGRAHVENICSALAPTG
jgi:hypothetical protein